MIFKELDGGLSVIDNLKVAGAKEGKYGVAVIVSENSDASAVFTSNKIVAAPVIYTKKVVEKGKVSAVFVNSGNANCFTGNQGIEDCESLVELVSKELNIPKGEIAISSTGVIGRKMPLDVITGVASKVFSSLGNKPEDSLAAANAIMTTDKIPKQCALEVTLTNGEKVKIAGITKGSGMIAPNMGTMLSFIVTDGVMESKYINKALKKAANKSFNINDGEIDPNFQEALEYLCIDLAKKMVKDGEGASKVIEANIYGAKNIDEARLAAKAIVTSPLFKSAVFGGDPNWGRIVSAIGYSGADVSADTVTIAIANKQDEVDLVKDGEILAFEGTDNLLRAEKIMLGEEVIVNVDLNKGDGEATAWGCDLSYDYVKINGDYRT